MLDRAAGYESAHLILVERPRSTDAGLYNKWSQIKDLALRSADVRLMDRKDERGAGVKRVER